MGNEHHPAAVFIAERMLMIQETSKTRNIRDRALPHFQRFRRELKNTTRNGVYMTNFEDFFED